MSNFNKENDESLINLIRCNSILFDASDKNYKNNDLKHKVWENISETMKIPVSDLKKRWKHLRDHYTKKKKAATGTGQARSENTWEYMSQLNFLSQVSSQRNTLTNAELSEVTATQINDHQNENGSSGCTSHENDPPNEIRSQDNVFLVEDISLDTAQNHEVVNNTSKNTEESLATPTIKRRQKTNDNSLASVLKHRQEERARVFEKLLTQSPEPKKSSIHNFFESMADIVSEFPPHLVAETRLKVCQLINDLEMKKNNDQYAWSSTPMPSCDSSDSYTNL